MTSSESIGHGTYGLTRWSVPGPVEAIPVLLYQRLDLAGPKAAVIHYHGVKASKDTHVSLSLIKSLADAGFLVALPDAPGHGERPGGPRLLDRVRENLPHEFCADIEQAADEAQSLFDWLGARPEVDPSRVAVIGHSMGGYTAAVVAMRAREHLAACVCIAGSADLAHCMEMTGGIAPGKGGPLDRSLDVETQERIARIDPLWHPERYPPLPLLLLHGEKDTWNPCATSQRFASLLEPHYVVAPECLRLTVVPDAAHWPLHTQMVQETVEWLHRFVLDNWAPR
jgi:dipeptidyl aminopeptidase/acylaminoacyl peptidase